MAIPKIQNYSIPTNIFENKALWELDASKSVLLIHDVQKYFVDFYDGNAEPMKGLLENIKALKFACKAAGIPVVYTAQPAQQTPEDRALLTDFWGHGVQDEREIIITPQLTPEADDHVFTKWRYSAFQRTPLHSFMAERKRNQLIVCGVYAHIGILATALEAFMTDIKTFVVQDAVADFSEQDHTMAMTYISQRCGNVLALKNIVEILNRVETSYSEQGSTHISRAKNQQYNTPAITAAGLKADIAKSLSVSPSELDEHDNLMDWGLDSIRLMALIEQWRTFVPQLQFSDLAETATLAEWAEIMGAAEADYA